MHFYLIKTCLEISKKRKKKEQGYREFLILLKQDNARKHVKLENKPLEFQVHQLSSNEIDSAVSCTFSTEDFSELFLAVTVHNVMTDGQQKTC